MDKWNIHLENAIIKFFKKNFHRQISLVVIVGFLGKRTRLLDIKNYISVKFQNYLVLFTPVMEEEKKMYFFFKIIFFSTKIEDKYFKFKQNGVLFERNKWLKFKVDKWIILLEIN